MNPENVCPKCQEYKKEKFDLCYNCNKAKATEEGRICKCGNFKKEGYDDCYECSQKNRS